LTLKPPHDVDEKTIGNIKKLHLKYVNGEVIFKQTIDPHIRGGFLAYNDELAINASIRNKS